MKALCVINGDVSGKIYFEQPTSNAIVKITGHVLGLSRGLHGFHVHEYGDLTDGCKSAGEHYNPTFQNHGAPNASVRHVGDLGNIVAHVSDALTEIFLEDDVISLYGPYSILGRSLVIHTNKDDLGLTDHPLSKTTGNSGSRLGCGIIGVCKE
ncbi:SOD [Urbanus proteus nucleopolyhedrovirus]|uniref:superoxide dismutase n=1 Tax=Urbanus proteus nucleopolyhedrovirus TaxID=1675866 RepID=A0A162GUZ9_9ABAC|nr:SOD [Urbanus proteus nucleopolyhedrovirus]AKR17383.1 SOD [Urbanus proteus nucleopolyhedrovirus]